RPDGALATPARLRLHRGQRASRTRQPRTAADRAALHRPAVSADDAGHRAPGGRCGEGWLRMRFDIDREYLLSQLERLLRIPSPTGYTDSIVHHVSAELEHLGVDAELTRRGEIRARLPGEQALGARAIVAHLDTLGAMVKRLKDNGRLEVVPIGHWSARFAEGARCTVFSDERVFRGTILPLKASGHTFNREVDSLPVGWDFVELRVDERSDNAADLVRHGIEPGDIVAIDPQFEFLDNGYI